VFADAARTLSKPTVLEIRRSSYNDDGWCVALNGTEVVGFFGPDARRRAEHHKDELAVLLNVLDTLNDKNPRGSNPSGQSGD
jgi:hypothetical protein